MRRTKLMLVGAALALSLSTASAGTALAQAEDPELAEECGAMSFFEWLFFGHQCHGHGGGQVYWPRFF
jgi:Spy/CpxP family protein refolding chaperone